MKIKQAQWAKKIALTTILVYFSLSVFVMFTVGQHALRHGRIGHHSVQHATLLCTWMCAASTHVFTLQQQLPKTLVHFSELIVFHAERIFSNSPLFAFYIRPPPNTRSFT